MRKRSNSPQRGAAEIQCVRVPSKMDRTWNKDDGSSSDEDPAPKIQRISSMNKINALNQSVLDPTWSKKEISIPDDSTMTEVTTMDGLGKGSTLLMDSPKQLEPIKTESPPRQQLKRQNAIRITNPGKTLDYQKGPEPGIFYSPSRLWFINKMKKRQSPDY